MLLTRSRRALLVGAIAAGATGLAGCSASVGSKTLNTDEAEKQIGSGLEKQAGSKVTVDCPSDVDAKAGATFTCKVKTAAGDTGTVKVTQKDDEGNISWALQ